MTPEQVAYLRSVDAAGPLASVRASDVEGDALLATLTRLRRTLEPEQAAAVVETVALRRRAQAKFSRAGDMLFTADGLEQATHEAVAAHRAARLRDLGVVDTVDLGTGIGGDALALGGLGPVAAVDLDPVRLAIAVHNAAVHGLEGRIHPVRADAATLPVLPVGAAFADPSRRADGGRIFDPDRYRPPLGLLVERWAGRVPVLAVKVAPGIPRSAVPDGAGLEVVSLDGTVREAVLWFGAGTSGRRRATLLPGGHVLRDDRSARAPVGPVGTHLFEPDGAVVRAGLVQEAAALAGARMIDPDIAYLTADEPLDSPFLTGYRVETVMPFNLKRLRAHLRGLGVGTVTIKKRGSPLTPEELRPRLGLSGDASRVVFLTRMSGAPTVVIALDQSGRAKIPDGFSS